MDATISLKLLVDKKKKQVVFAESGHEFVDNLLSLLTLPLGKIIRLLGKQSMVGCMDKLYESVEKLDTQYLQTEACKTMLLEPRSSVEMECENLKLPLLENQRPRRLFTCGDFDCLTKTHCVYSPVCGTPCHCGEVMNKRVSTRRSEFGDDGDGVFVKGGTRFIITDDLHVWPASTSLTLSMLKKLRIRDAQRLEQLNVDIGKEKMMKLLRRLLLSKTPLTDVFLRELEYSSDHNEAAEALIGSTRVEPIRDADSGSKLIRVKLLQSKSDDEVVLAEGGADFVDLLFSFLTFPLGSIVQLLGKHSSVGCIHSLYESVGAARDYIKSDERKGMLLSPTLRSHFGCSSQLLRIEERQEDDCFVHGCEYCWRLKLAARDDESGCEHGLHLVRLREINPKLPDSGNPYGGGYAKRSVQFMVTGEMFLTPLSPVSEINLIKQSNVPIGDLIQREVTLGKSEALNILKGCLLSQNAAFNFFPPTKRRKLH